jgi:hypothetical protein
VLRAARQICSHTPVFLLISSLSDTGLHLVLFVLFPTIYALLNIAVVIPVSTATPERTFSAMRLLKTHLRNRSIENRLNGLAYMYFNSASAVDVQDVITRFASIKNS